MSNLEDLSTFMENHVDEERVRDALMSAKIDEMSEQIKILTTQMDSLVTAWNQAKGVLYFIKWAVGISGSVVAFILFIKEHIK